MKIFLAVLSVLWLISVDVVFAKGKRSDANYKAREIVNSVISGGFNELDRIYVPGRSVNILVEGKWFEFAKKYSKSMNDRIFRFGGYLDFDIRRYEYGKTPENFEIDIVILFNNDVTSKRLAKGLGFPFDVHENDECYNKIKISRGGAAGIIVGIINYEKSEEKDIEKCIHSVIMINSKIMFKDGYRGGLDNLIKTGEYVTNVPDEFYEYLGYMASIEESGIVSVGSLIRMLKRKIELRRN